jgi:hypothetical protein
VRRVFSLAVVLAAVPALAWAQEAGDPFRVSFAAPSGQQPPVAMERGLRVRVKCSEPCRVRLWLGNTGRKVGEGSARSARAGKFMLRAHFNRRARRRFASVEQLDLKARLVAHSDAGVREQRTDALHLPGR